MKAKKIVVFGCDNTGKTTLCEILREKLFTLGELDTVIAKSLGPNKTVEEQVDFMERTLNDNEKNIIFDRFPIIEEATSGKVLRNKNNFAEWEDTDVMELLKKVDLFIFCYPGLFNVLNWGEREQLDGVKNNALKLINAYNEMAVALKSLGFKVFEYNYNSTKFYDILKEVCE